MAYKDNWLRHFFAALTGEGFSRTLARDFWPSEDLWNFDVSIQWRWLKLVWVKSMSVITQMTLPVLAIYPLVNLFQEISLRWWLIVAGSGSALMLVSGALFATIEYFFPTRTKSSALSPETDTQPRTTSYQTEVDSLSNNLAWNDKQRLPVSLQIKSPETTAQNIDEAKFEIVDGKATLVVKRRK